MARFLLTHTVKDIYESQEDLIRDWKGLRRRTHQDAQWLRSLYSAAAQRLYCEWEAVDPEAIRACFLPNELDMAPIERLDEVILMDPAWLDEATTASGASA